VFRENSAEFLLENARRYGDLVGFSAFGRRVVQFNHPELIQEMLVRDAGHHHRNLVMQRSKSILGEGLLTSEEPLHMRQRRLAAPAFHRQRIAAYGDVISAETAAMTRGWRNRAGLDGAVLDVRREMLLLALRIVGRTLFSAEFDEDLETIAAAVDSFQGFLPLAFMPFSDWLQRSPLPAMQRIRRGREELDGLIYRMIAERRADARDRGDLLSMLLAATDAESAGAGMSDAQVRDECLTILLAGHETTANALSFALWLLGRHRAVQDALAEESRRVLDGRLATAADYAQLGLAEQVFAEALRLYPPVWVTARTAAESYAYRGMTIERGSILLAPQFAVHRDARFYEDPLRFDPGRFSAAGKASRPKMAYFPFGAGNRQCNGEGLAWMEGTLCLATMMQEWEVTRPAGVGDELRLDPSVSLRPRGAVMLRVRWRDG
jgi:cytochrome P450